MGMNLGVRAVPVVIVLVSYTIDVDATDRCLFLSLASIVTVSPVFKIQAPCNIIYDIDWDVGARAVSIV